MLAGLSARGKIDLKILILTDVMSVVGGVESYLHTILPELEALGHEIVVVTVLPGDEGRSWIQSGIKKECPVWIINEIGIQQTVLKAKQWGAEIVFSSELLNPEHQLQFAKAFPSVLFAHNLGGMCISVFKRFRSPSLQMCTKPLSASCLAYYFPRRCGGLNPVKMLQDYRRETARRDARPEFRQVVVASHYMAGEIERHGIEKDKITRIPYPLTRTQTIDSRSIGNLNRVFYIGRLTELKGWRVLVESIKLAEERLGRSLQLVVAGEGPDRLPFENAATDRGIDATFLGWIEPSRRSEELQKADLLVMPSLWPEPFGLVGIEAAQIGVPVVAFDVGGISDWLQHKVTGELVSIEGSREQGLAASMASVLSDPVYWKQLSDNSRRNALNYDIDEHIRQLLSVFRMAINGSVA